jgi:hypothetical protein
MKYERYSIVAVTLDLWDTLIFEKEGYDSERSLIRCNNLSRVLFNYGIDLPTERLVNALKGMSTWLFPIWDRISNAKCNHTIFNAEKLAEMMRKETPLNSSGSYGSYELDLYYSFLTFLTPLETPHIFMAPGNGTKLFT